MAAVTLADVPLVATSPSVTRVTSLAAATTLFLLSDCATSMIFFAIFSAPVRPVFSSSSASHFL
jgi:hypothetical protein